MNSVILSLSSKKGEGRNDGYGWREAGAEEVGTRGRKGNWLLSTEVDDIARQHLLAFRDFCLDLIEEESGLIPMEEENDIGPMKKPPQKKIAD